MEYVQCPHCQKKYGVNDTVREWVGKKCRCKQCKGTMEVIIQSAQPQQPAPSSPKPDSAPGEVASVQKTVARYDPDSAINVGNKKRSALSRLLGLIGLGKAKGGWIGTCPNCSKEILWHTKNRDETAQGELKCPSCNADVVFHAGEFVHASPASGSKQTVSAGASLAPHAVHGSEGEVEKEFVKCPNCEDVFESSPDNRAFKSVHTCPNCKLMFAQAAVTGLESEKDNLEYTII